MAQRSGSSPTRRVHRLQGVRGGLPPVERPPRARARRSPAAELRQHRPLSDVDWRHVKFIEQFSRRPVGGRWLMMSDVCKHCVDAACLEVCPTGAIIRTEFDTVYIQEPACNGCRDCIAACPFGVIHVSASKHIAQKCTFCYDRLQNGLVPACAQACPTGSIQFGPIEELRERAAGARRAAALAGGRGGVPLRADEKILAGCNAFYLLMDTPKTTGCPTGGPQGPQPHPSGRRPSRGSPPRWRWASGRSWRFGRRRLAVAKAGKGWRDEPSTSSPIPTGSGYIVWYFYLGGIAGGRLRAGRSWRTSSATRTTAAPRGSPTTSPSRWSASAGCFWSSTSAARSGSGTC